MQSQSLRSPFEEPAFGPPPSLPPELLDRGSGASRRAKRKTELTHKSKKPGRGGKGAAILAFILLLGGASGAGLYGYTKLTGTQAELDETKTQLTAAMSRAAKAERAAMSASADLSRSQSLLEESKESLAQAEAIAMAKEKASDELEAKLAGLLEDGQGQVLKGKDGRFTLQLVDKVLFRSGEAELTERGQRVMGRVGQALLEMKDKQIWVQGHTDRVPIKDTSGPFASNWELSAARALTVVHYLQESSQVNPRRLAAAAFGSHRPVSRRNKAKNRRIEIVLFPRELTIEP